ncbi:MAG: hypothetical protein ACI4TH_07810, partial [Candidatus Ornithomonoglobus sp.]
NNIERLEREIKSINENNEQRGALIKQTEGEIEEKQKEIEKITSALSGSRSAAEEYDVSINAIDEKLSALRNDYFARQNDISSEQERANGVEKLRGSFLERREAVYAEISSYKEGIENTKNQIADTEKDLGDRKNKLADLSGTVNELTQSKEKTESRLKEINARLASMQVDYNTKSSKKKMLEGLENDYAGYSRSVKSVLTAQELKRLAIYGTISGLVDVEKRYVTAIETALGGALQNIIVESEEDAKQAIAYLRRTGGGRATFLPVTSVKGRTLDNAREVSRAPGFIGIASELIHYEKKYDGIFASLLGRVVVVDNIDNAIALSRKFGYRFKTVTLEGDVLNAGGSMSGGSVNKQSGFLSRATEIKTLTSEISAMLRDVKKLQEERDSLNNDMSLIDGQLESFVPLVREYEDEILKLENTLKMLNESLEGSDSASYDAELEMIETQLKDTADEVARLIAHVSSMKTRNSHIESDITELMDKRNELLEKKNSAAEETTEITEQLAELNKDIAVSRETINSAYAEINRSKDEISSRRAAAQEHRRANEDTAAHIQEKKRHLEDSKKLSEEIKEKLRTIDERKSDISDRIERFQGDSKDILDRIVELERELTRVDNRRVKLQTERDSTLNRLWDEYELGYNDALELRTEVENIKDAVEELAGLKRKIKALGSVNMDAIEEYRSVKERYEFMTTQKADLEKSKD